MPITTAPRCTIRVGTISFEKSMGGPFIGPNGGKWADSHHTIPWHPDDPHGARAIHALHPNLSTAKAHKLYLQHGGTIQNLSTWQHHHIAAKRLAAQAAAASGAVTTPAVPTPAAVAAPAPPPVATAPAPVAAPAMVAAGTVTSGPTQHSFAPTAADPHMAHQILAAHPGIGNTAAWNLYKQAGGQLPKTTWQHKIIAARHALGATQPVAAPTPAGPTHHIGQVLTPATATTAPTGPVPGQTMLVVAHIANLPIGSKIKKNAKIYTKTAHNVWTRVGFAGVGHFDASMLGGTLHTLTTGPAPAPAPVVTPAAPHAVGAKLTAVHLAALPVGATVKGKNTGTLYTKAANGTWLSANYDPQSSAYLGDKVRFVSHVPAPAPPALVSTPKIAPPPGSAAYRLAALVAGHKLFTTGATQQAGYGGEMTPGVTAGAITVAAAEIPALLGIPSKAKFTLFSSGISSPGSRVSVDSAGCRMDRDIRSGPPPYIYNAFFKLATGHAHGVTGTDVFAQQVVASAAAGFSYIKCSAHRNESNTSFNGYYTWARFGYEPVNGPAHPVAAAINNKASAKTAAAAIGITETTPLVDVMKSQAGRDWWKNHGVTWDAKFDLAPDSHSVKTLTAYLAAKKGEVAKSITDDSDGTDNDEQEEISLTAEDEAILDRIWDDHANATSSHDRIAKSLGGPFVGPHGGQWADSKHTISWQPNDPHGAKAIHASHPHLYTTDAHKIYAAAGGTLTRHEWRPHYLAAVATAQAATGAAGGSVTAAPSPAAVAAPAAKPAAAAAPAWPQEIQATDVAGIDPGKGKKVLARLKSGATRLVEVGFAGGLRTTGLSQSEFVALSTWQRQQHGATQTDAAAQAQTEWAKYGGLPSTPPQAAPPPQLIIAKPGAAPVAVAQPVTPYPSAPVEPEQVKARVAAVAQAVAAKLGMTPDQVKSALTGAAKPNSGKGKIRAKITDAILTGGHSVTNAIAHLGKDKAASSALAVSLATPGSDTVRIAKEYADTPRFDLQVLGAITAKTTPKGAFCQVYERTVTMGSDSATGDFRHELGHAVHATHFVEAKDTAWNKAVTAHYTAAKQAQTANPGPGIKSHQWYEENYGVIGKRGLDDAKEDLAEHYRGYHKAIYQDEDGSSGGSALTAYRTRHPLMASLWDAHYTAAMLGEHL